MAARSNVTGTAAWRKEEDYQRARCYALATARDYARGPGPFTKELPACCWEQVWLGNCWGVSPVCNHPGWSWRSEGPSCDHEHHKDEVWLAIAA